MTDDQLPKASADEFVMFTSRDGKVSVECRFESETLWLSQAMMCELYGKAKATVREHIKQFFAVRKLREESVVRLYRTTAAFRTLGRDPIDKPVTRYHNSVTTHPSQYHSVGFCLGRKNRLMGGFFISGTGKVL